MRTDLADLLPAKPVRGARSATLAKRLRAVLDQRVRDLLTHEPGTRSGVDAESLHQMRVAVRRLRSVLKQYREVLDPTWEAHLRTELGRLGRALGEVRDLDVLLAHFRSEIATFGPDDTLAAKPLIDILLKRRVEARRELIAALDSSWFELLVRTLATAADSGLPIVAPEAKQSTTATKKVVREPLRTLNKAARAHGPDATDEVLHKLRIKGKRLRYAAETLPRKKTTTKLIRASRKLQEILGDHQDACVARHQLEQLLDAGLQPRTAYVAGRLVEREDIIRRATREQWYDAYRTVRRAGKAIS